MKHGLAVVVALVCLALVLSLVPDVSAGNSVSSRKGTWTANGASPQSITAVGFLPKALIVWSVGPGATETQLDDTIASVGFATRRGGATQQGTFGVKSEDGSNPTSTGRVINTAAMLHVLSAETTTDYTVSLSTFDADGFTVTYSSAANADGDTYGYLAWGGSDITDANVISDTLATSGASQAFTCGFQPNIIFGMWTNQVTSNSPGVHMAFTFGWAISTSLMAGFGAAEDDGVSGTAQMDWNSKLASTSILNGYAGGSGTQDGILDLDSFDASGFTLGINNAPGTANTIAIFLAIQGGSWNGGNTDVAPGTGNQVFSFSTPTFTPKGFLGMSRDFNTEASAVSAIMTLGAGTSTDGTQEGALVFFGRDATLPTQEMRIQRTAKAMAFYNVESGGVNPLETEGDLVAFASGSFTIDWTTAGNTDDIFMWIVWGDSPDVTPPVRSNGQPTGTFPSGTTSVIISLDTNEAATCKYGTTAGQTYAAMPNTYSTTGGTSHSSTFGGLTDGNSYTVYTRCQDGSSNPNTDDFSVTFSVLSPPQRSNGQPTGTLVSGTTQTTISLNTDVNSTCRYATTAGVAYADMTNTFSTTGGTSHSTLVTGLSDGGSFSYYVRCTDGTNTNTDDFVISFSVGVPPNRSNGAPTGELAAGTTQTTISLTTDVSATCKWSNVAGTAYAAMANTFSTTGGTSHSTLVTGLSDGLTFTYHVRCQETNGDTNLDDFTIQFSVAEGGGGPPPPPPGDGCFAALPEPAGSLLSTTIPFLLAAGALILIVGMVRVEGARRSGDKSATAELMALGLGTFLILILEIVFARELLTGC